MHPTLALIETERIGEDKDYTEELRHRAKTDHFFLAPLLGYYDFRPDLHGAARDLYVQKKPGRSLEDQDGVKNRLHLDPRHTFKTTMGVVDTVQWVLVSPEVTVVNEAATQGLAKLLTGRQTRPFIVTKSKAPTIFQQLFPEYCTPKPKGGWRCPCSTVDTVEPTIYSTSIGSSQSGYHPWVLNPDDTADTANSGISATDASRDKVWDSYVTNLNTVRHGGYQNVRGTRYHPFDMYGRLLRSVDPTLWKMLIRSSVTVKSGQRLIEGEFPAEEDLVLHFPGMLDYPKLRELFKEYGPFMCQQQNDPQGGGVAKIPAELYDQAQMDEELIPQLGTVRVCWRMPSDTKPYMRRYAVGCAVMDWNGRLYVLDTWRGVYTLSELAERVVRSCKRYQTGDLTIEKTPGSEAIVPVIQNEAMMRNVSLQIARPDFEPDDTKRSGRCEGVEPMLRAGRLWFSRGMYQRDECRTQYTNFGLMEENGFPDVVSQLTSRMSASHIMQQVSEAQRQRRMAGKDRDAWDAVYAQGGATAVDDSIGEVNRANRALQNSYGLPSMLGGLDG